MNIVFQFYIYYIIYCFLDDHFNFSKFHFQISFSECDKNSVKPFTLLIHHSVNAFWKYLEGRHFLFINLHPDHPPYIWKKSTAFKETETA